ncbi:hypothetical protein HQ545_04320 [Candidatus Woesearchaeota archaeon]|nr:hypothetical protein [Candidatus Woesearchaeota archaeon]
MSSAIEKAKKKAKQIDRESLNKLGIERTHEEYYIVGNYPPLAALDDVVEKGIDIFEGAGPRETDIYIHIPFCLQSCNFCHFYYEKIDDPDVERAQIIGGEKSAEIAQKEKDRIEKYLSNLKQEISMVAEKVGGITARSIYIGGGTPSVLSAEQISDLFSHIRQYVSVPDEAEIKFDVHPQVAHDSERVAKFKALREAGVNKIAIGGVCLDDSVCSKQSRMHSGKDTAKLAIELKSVYGFDHVRTDLMMGTQRQTPENWEADLDELIEKCEVDCAMAFPLMFKASAQIYKSFVRDPAKFPSIEERDLLYLIAIEKFKEKGYTQDLLFYFNRESEEDDQQMRKFKSLDETEMLCFGPTGFGFVNGHQYFNAPDEVSYNTAIEQGKLPVWRAAKLTERQLFERDVIFGLRTAEGVDKERMMKKYGRDLSTEYSTQISQFCEAGLLESDEEGIRLTEIGKLRGDEIAASFGGDDVRLKSEQVAMKEDPAGPVQRYHYHPHGHRLR